MNALHKDYLFICGCGYRGCELIFNDANPHGRCPECNKAREEIMQVPLDTLLNACRNSGVRKRELRRVNDAIERANLRLFRAGTLAADAISAQHRAEAKLSMSEASEGSHRRHVADLRSENQRLKKVLDHEHEKKCADAGAKFKYEGLQREQS